MKYTKPTLLTLALAFLAGGCSIIADFSTEVYYNLDNPVPVCADEMIDTLCTIRYNIGDKYQQTIIRDQKNLDCFLYVMLWEAEKGGNVSLQTDPGTPSSEQKAFSPGGEPVTFTTNDSNRAKEWIKKMLLKGYKVSIVYNRKEKTFTCTAYKSK